MKQILTLFILSLLIAAAGCSTTGQAGKSGWGERDTTLLNNKWTLMKWMGNPINVKEASKGLPQITFDLKERRFAGHTGCNNMNGTFSFNDDTMTFGPIMTTRMACMGYEFEGTFVNGLSNTSFFWKTTRTNLHLFKEGKEIAIFRMEE